MAGRHDNRTHGGVDPCVGGVAKTRSKGLPRLVDCRQVMFFGCSANHPSNGLPCKHVSCSANSVCFHCVLNMNAAIAYAHVCMYVCVVMVSMLWLELKLQLSSNIQHYTV